MGLFRFGAGVFLSLYTRKCINSYKESLMSELERSELVEPILVLLDHRRALVEHMIAHNDNSLQCVLDSTDRLIERLSGIDTVSVSSGSVDSSLYREWVFGERKLPKLWANMDPFVFPPGSQIWFPNEDRWRDETNGGDPMSGYKAREIESDLMYGCRVRVPVGSLPGFA